MDATLSTKITIPEGLVKAQIHGLLNENTILTDEITFDVQEGMLFPSTYHFHRGTTRDHILKRMNEKMKKQLDEIWQSRAKNHPKTINDKTELLILASIIEKEAILDRERPHISGVFYNRLLKNVRPAI